MYRIEVGAADEATLIFTVTAHWQARLPEVQALRAATPAFVAGQQVRITGSHRQGHAGKVIEVQPMEPQREEGTGEGWRFTVYFEDGMVWRYGAGELASMGEG